VPKSVGSKGDFGDFLPSERHADGCVRLAKCDFLLTFCSDLRLGGTVVSVYLLLLPCFFSANKDYHQSNCNQQKKKKYVAFIEPPSLRDAVKKLKRALFVMQE